MKKKSTSSEKNFGILFFIIFIIYGIWPIIHSHNIRIWSIIVGIILLVISLLKPTLLRLPNKIWLKFGELLGKIISPIVMAFVYFLIITLLALTLRLFGKDLLNTKFNSKIAYWINRKQILLQ